MQICCGNRFKKASIRSLSEAQIQELRRFSLKENCERYNHTDSFVFARIYEKFNDKSICAGVLVHQKFLVTTAICVLTWVRKYLLKIIKEWRLKLIDSYSKKPGDLMVKFGSDQHDEVSEIITHPNFYKSIDTLQDNIVKTLLHSRMKSLPDSKNIFRQF